MLKALRPPLFVLLLVLLLPAVGTGTAQAQLVWRSGWFHIAWGDAPPGSGGPQEVTRYELVGDDGETTTLLLDETLVQPYGGARAFNRAWVYVVGDAVAGTPDTLAVQGLQVEGSAGAYGWTGAAAAASPDQALSGAQPWLTILCRFGDSTGATPHPSSYYTELMGTSYPGLDHYTRENSYGQVDLTGSVAVGWYNLPQPRSAYFIGSTFDRAKAATDCTAAADPDVFFPNFVGVQLMFNQSLDGFSWGGSRTLSLDGQVRPYGMTWIAASMQNQRVPAHEMGHAAGLPHSSGPYSTPYDSQWDVMSGGGTCSPPHGTYGCLAVHTISHHKNLLGWIPSARQVVVPPGESRTVILERLAQPLSTDSYLMAKVPIGGSSTLFYTVEARRFAGYDGQIPGEAIVIHQVDTTRSDRDAQVVDIDANRDPNDAAAQWMPGETFTDAAYQITVAVEARTASGFFVTIMNAPPVTLQFSAATYSVSEVSLAATITVRRTGPTGPIVTVDYSTSNGTATPWVDYTPTSGTLTFGAGVTTKTFTVPILPDTIAEGPETVNLSLSNPTNGAVLGTPGTAVLTILDNDQGGLTRWSRATYTVSEAGPTAKLTVVRTGRNLASAVTVDYAVTGGTATNGGVDYTLANGTLTFDAGETSKTIIIPIVDDTLAEGPETVVLTLSNATGGATLGSPTSATLTITDNDFGGTIRFGSATYSVNENAGPATLTVVRSGGLASGVSVDYAVTGGTATGGGVDYTLANGTLTFGAGETAKTITIPIVNDGEAEGNETVVLTLSNARGSASLGSPATATLTILDDEQAVQFSQANYTVSEVGRVATITVVRTGPPTGTVAVPYSTTTAGTATPGPGGDFLPVAGTLAFLPGQMSRTFTIPILDDTVVDGPKTVGLALGTPTGALLGPQSTATLTSLDNDQGGVIRFSAATYRVTEGGTATITVKRTGGAASGVTVNYAVTGGTATDGGVDYTLGGSGTLTFGAGETTKTFTVQTVDDAIVEGPETVQLALSNATGGATLGTPNASVLTILDNDTLPPPSASLFIPAGQVVSGCFNPFNGQSVVNAQTLLAFGGAPLSGYTWTLSNLSTFPPGTTVTPLTGVFRGTGGTVVPGNYLFNMTVSDGSITGTGTIQAVMTQATDRAIGCGAAVFQQPFGGLAVLAVAGRSLGGTLPVTGGAPPYTWALATGSLPPGLVLDAVRGVIRGVPFSSAAGQAFPFTLTVRDSNNAVAVCPNAGVCPVYTINVR